MEWFKLHSKGILKGSLANSDDVVQLTWIKLLALVNESKFRNGRLEYIKGKPYTLEYIAANCNVPVTILQGCLCEYQEDVNPETGESRITVEEDGTIVVNNWDFYQIDKKHKNGRNNGQQAFAIRRSEEEKLRVLHNKYPGMAFEVIRKDFGCDIVNRSTGEVMDSIREGV